MGELTVERLRRKASAAKSLLSRYQNELDNHRRRSGPPNIAEYNRLVDKVKRQSEVFQQAVHAWKESQDG